MSKTIQIPTINATILFDAQTVTREELIDTAVNFHNGDTGLCNYVVGLIGQIAELRGFAPITLADVAPHRTHVWGVLTFATKEGMNSISSNFTTELIDYMLVNGQQRYVVLLYVGKRPEPISIAKKLKEIGAHQIRS